jgi:predicted Zn-dependent protease
MSAAPVMTRDDARALVERVVKMSQADAVQVDISGGHQTNVRFADNRVTTSGGVSDLSIGIYSAFGSKHAVASTNDVSDAGLERAVRQSETLARLAPDDPEALPLLGPQEYRQSRAYFESTAALIPQARVQPARLAIAAAQADGGLKAAGFIAAGAGMAAIGNNRGLFAYHPSTSVNYTLTVRTADGTGSGWAGADHPDWSQIDFNAVADTAIRKARLSRNPQPIEPGRYTVILEPQAVGDLVQRMGNALNARTADEGRSAFAKRGGGSRVGERIVDERISLFSDPTDPQLLDTPFDEQGLPLARQMWIENGVLRTLAYSRFWAQKQNRQPTGSANALKLTGGNASVDDMIRSTPRGVLVTRFWYIRPVDPRTLLFTGLTRDGTFLIEDGKISKPVQNLRFNESPLFMLNNVEMVGRPVRIAGTEAGGNVVLPPLKIREFNFTSISEAV